MDDLETFENTLVSDRLRSACTFVQRFPDFPPSSTSVTVIITYDDGHHLRLDIEQKQPNGKRGRFRAWLRGKL